MIDGGINGIFAFAGFYQCPQSGCVIKLVRLGGKVSGAGIYNLADAVCI